MTDLQTLLDRNREFAAGFDRGDLPMAPRFATIVVTCLDPRVDPAHFLGLELGDAFVMRVVGGRVTDAVTEQIAILRAIAGLAGGVSALEVAVVHHTGCAVQRLTDPQVRRSLGQATGTSESTMQGLAASEPAVSVAEDLERLRGARILPDDLVVSGYVYDVTDGHLSEVSAPSALRNPEEA